MPENGYAWKSRPVFISSTFKDMHAERDWLRHHVFPRLEENLRKRRYHLEPIDLRLGVEAAEAGTEEERELLVLKVCLNEIKRSRPYLLVLLGDRYGWTPPEERLDAATKEQGFETSVKGKSVTAIEIEFGIMKEDPENKISSLFFFRNPLPYTSMTQELAERYCDACSRDPHIRAGYDRLVELKEQLLCDPELRSRVFTYSTRWDGTAHVTGLEEFGDLVYKHLWQALEEETKAYLAQPPPTWEDEERMLLSEFCVQRHRNFIGRKELITSLLDLAQAPAGYKADWGACVTGPQGSGKSALFAELNHRLSGENNILLLANAAGGTLRGSRVASMLVRWVKELADFLKKKNPLSNNPTSDDLDSAFLALVRQAAQTRRVVFLLDALDQFEPTVRGQHLTWLKGRQWPPNARIIATSLPGVPADALSQWAGVVEINLTPLTLEDAVEIGTQVWKHYHRTIHREVLSALTVKREADGNLATGNPLWLTLALEQLSLLDGDDFGRAEREFTGSPTERMHALLLDTASRMPPDLKELYGWLLVQNEKVFGPPATRAFSVAICLSYCGWREKDLLELIPRLAPLVAPDSPETKMNDLRLAALRRGFRAYLVRRGEEGLLDFAHAGMRDAVASKYLSDNALLINLHGRISDYLETLPLDDPMIRAERMRQLIGERNRSRTARYYAGVDATDGINQIERSGPTWTLVEWIVSGEGSTKDRSATETNVNLKWLVSWLDEPCIEPDEVYRLTANFQFGLLDQLEKELRLNTRRLLIEQTIDALERLVALDPTNVQWQRDLSVIHTKLGNILIEEGDTAGAIAAYRASLTIIEQLATQDPTNADWQRNLSISHYSVGDVLFAQGDVTRALSAYRTGIAISQCLAAQDPTNARLQIDLYLAHFRVGITLLAQGDALGAIASYRSALRTKALQNRTDSTEALENQAPIISCTEKDCFHIVPRNAGGILPITIYRVGLTINERYTMKVDRSIEHVRYPIMKQINIGDTFLAYGDSAGTLSSFHAALVIRELQTNADPSNAKWQRNLTSFYGYVGDVLLALGNADGAIIIYRTDLAISERLSAEDPTNTDWQRDLSVRHERLGDALRAQRDYTGALISYRASIAIKERLVAIDPTNAKWQRGLSVGYERLGICLQAQGDSTGALTAYQASLAIRERLAAQDTTNAEWQRDLVIILFNLAVCFVKSGDKREAQFFFSHCRDTLYRMKEKGMSIDPTLARILNKLAEKKPELSPTGKPICPTCKLECEKGALFCKWCKASFWEKT